MTFKKVVKTLVGGGFAALFLWLILRHLSIDELRSALAGAVPHWVLAALLAFGAGYACRIQRWRLMLNQDNPGLRWRQCAGPLLASFAANNVLPFRAGDVLRSFAFSRQLGTSSGVVIATLFVERLLDLLMLLLVLGGALAWFGLETSRFAGVGGTVLLAAALGILLLLLFPGLFAPLARAAGRLAARLAPRLGSRLLREIDKSLATLQHLAQGVTMFKLVLWSGLAWLAEGGVFWGAALALPSLAAPLAAWLALPVGTLATLIPSTPGYVGTFDFFTVRAMTALGNGTAAATAYALLVHVLLWLPPTVAGGLYLLFHPVQRPAS